MSPHRGRSTTLLLDYFWLCVLSFGPLNKVKQTCTWYIYIYILVLFCLKKLRECRGKLLPLSCSCCMLCLCASVSFRSEIGRQVISRLLEPAMTSLPLHHRPNAIRASHVIHRAGSSKPFISAMGHIITIVTWSNSQCYSFSSSSLHSPILIRVTDSWSMKMEKVDKHAHARTCTCTSVTWSHTLTLKSMHGWSK